MGRRILGKKFEIPPPKKLPGTDVTLPHVIVGDEAFRLEENLMKPYPRIQSLHDNAKAIYNYRLSRARRIVENAFGILCTQFRLFHTAINAKPETIDNLITAACILHNIMRDARDTKSNYDMNIEEQQILDDILPSISDADGRSSFQIQEIRDNFKIYFNGIGAVPWQNKRIGLN